MADSNINLPVILPLTGPQPTAPAEILQQLTQLVSAQVPGYTNNLPGSLVEDIASTGLYAIVLIDQARVETENSITPLGSNEFLLNQQGQQFGLMLGQPTNTSANVVFSGTPYFAIPVGFAVSDGTQLYVVITGTVIGEGGSSQPTTVVAVNPGSWPVPANSVNQVVTSVPSAYTVTVNNPDAGTPGQLDPESWPSYRARINSAYRAAGTGMPSTIRTYVGGVPSVLQRSISIQTPATGGILVLASGGDEVATAYAIYSATLDPTRLVGSVNVISGITKANPGVVTTSLFHGLVTGDTAVISGSNPTDWNGSYTIIVLTDYTFSIGVDTTGYTTYVGSGIVTPNPRNVTIPIIDYPDTYQVPFANPLTQVVTGTCTWNTSASNFNAAGAMNAAALPALVAYINSIPTGEPINILELNAAFLAATASILPNNLLTRLVFDIDIDGVGVSPGSGTYQVQGDQQSLLSAAANAFVVSQG